MNIGSKIRLARRQKDMTQETLGEYAGVTASFISRIENNQSGIELETLSKIAKALDIPLKELVDNQPVTEPTKVSEKGAVYFSMPGHLTEEEQKKIINVLDALSNTEPGKRETAIQVVDTILKGN